MTALAACWQYDRNEAAGQDVARMLAAQAMYGRDGTAQTDLGGVAIGRNLWRRLPGDRQDRQPLTDGRHTLVADVRLDDRAGLAAALDIAPNVAERLADADFLLRAWEKWGAGLFDHVYGDYAFILWDETAGTLILARDAFGAFPLHYHRGDGFVAVASMPKGLHALDRIERRPDTERAAEQLVLLGDHGPRTFFVGVNRVQMGEMVTISPEGVTSVRHWNPPTTRARYVPGTDYAGQLTAHLDRAVATRLRGAGDAVATHLSAGFDSSAVTASAALAMAKTGGRVVAFTAAPRSGYDGPEPKGRDGHEDVVAAQTAALYPNVDHAVVRPGGARAIHDMDRDVHLYDRPVLNPCNHVWIAEIDAAIRQRGLSVLLGGGKGNATISFDGEQFLAELAASGRWWRLWRMGRAAVATRRTRWRGVLRNAFGGMLPVPLWLAVNRLFGRPPPDTRQFSALRPELYADLDISARSENAGIDIHYRPLATATEAQLRMCQRGDAANFNKGALACWGVDKRDPTGDRALVEFCLTLPMEAYRPGGEARGLAMAAFADRLPAKVVGGRLKGLQSIDWHEGLTASRDDLRVELDRLADVPEAASLLDLPRMRALIDDWPEDGWNDPATIHAYRLLLMRGTAVGHFLRRASGSNA